ncbi:restriction endonuclease subunit S [Lysobacter ciconiae]|uniref:Restriction endonuclease subunit S n=1 Tax=Novilysobacter ciconiae TaxID=2781022 RepID=A0A7S6ZSU6_9GAMM|nr:restriction endonuclease subunit S [Lysobacter ciconiae]QOW20223.1 restriction endonuclease subunit S [Lysobacter ciconiae]
MSWRSVALGELCDLEIGKTPSRAEPEFWRGGTLPWLSIADMNQGRNLQFTKECVTDAGARAARMKIVKPGTLLLSYKLSIGKVGVARIPMYTNEAIAALSNLSSEVDPDFMYWALQHVDLLQGADRAAMGATLNKAKLTAIKFPVPPLTEQRRIAAILDKADALRAKRREAIAKLDQLLQSVFIDMFGEPTSNPKRWPMVALADLGDIHTGKTPPTAVTGVFDGDVPFVTPGDLSRPMFRAERTITELGATYTKVVRAGSALVGCIGSIGKIAKAPVPCSFNQQINAVDWNYDLVDDDFGVAALVCRTPQMLALSSATTVPILNKSAFSRVTIPIPPIALQKRFSRKVAAVESSSACHREQLRRIDYLFASLENELFENRVQ